ncbi:MAG: cardiolipin synthase [Myxococcota bacterium]
MGAAWDFMVRWWVVIDWSTAALALLSVPSVLVQRRGRPMAAVSWILALVTLPIGGLLLWWLIGRRHLRRPSRRKRRAHDELASQLAAVRSQLAEDEPPEASPPAPSDHDTSDDRAILPVSHLPLEFLGSVFPPCGGNETVLIDAHEAFAIMDRDIRAATRHVHVLFYIWKDDETGRRVRDALVDRARAGVEVRVLADAVGSPAFGTRFVRPLRDAGAQVQRFLPPRLLSRTPRLNFRNHRKVLVVDGQVGFLGGFNIADEYRLRWHDMGVRIAGPAVDQLQEIFADDWFFSAGENLADPSYFGHYAGRAPPGDAIVGAVASGPDTEGSPIEDALFIAINQTQRRLYISTPYFIPPRATVAALRAAVFRGVDVRVLVPARSDIPLVRWASRSYYPELLAAGVRIFEYLPVMLHAKAAVFDEALSLIGSANIDQRSFRLNFESSAFIRDASLNQSLAHVFEDDLTRSEEVEAARFDRRPWGSKLVDATAHLLSPLL